MIPKLKGASENIKFRYLDIGILYNTPYVLIKKYNIFGKNILIKIIFNVKTGCNCIIITSRLYNI